MACRSRRRCYDGPVNPGASSSLFHPLVWCLLAIYLQTPLLWAEERKIIRLRNEPIATPDRPEKGLSRKIEKNLSGLHLIQFTGSLQPEWKNALDALGVDLVRYVPDDAFVARCFTVDMGQLQSLEFVRWIGPFRPEHKIHFPLQQAANRRAPDEELNVRVLLAPRTAPVDAANAFSWNLRIGLSPFSTSR